MRKAVIKQSDGLVVNIIEIKAGAKWQTPENCYLIDAGKGSPGDTWDGKKFTKPEPVISEPVRDLEAEVDELKAEVARLKRR